MSIVIRYEFEYFSFFVIVKLFTAENLKKYVFIVFTVPIVTIDGFSKQKENANANANEGQIKDRKGWQMQIKDRKKGKSKIGKIFDYYRERNLGDH